MYRIVAKIPERELGIVGDFLVWKKFLEERVVAHQADRVEFERMLLLRRGVLHLCPEETNRPHPTQMGYPAPQRVNSPVVTPNCGEPTSSTRLRVAVMDILPGITS